MPALNGQWRKATASTNNGACVEVRLDRQVQVRDTKQVGRGPVLAFAPEAWAGFLAGIRAGELDRP